MKLIEKKVGKSLEHMGTAKFPEQSNSLCSKIKNQQMGPNKIETSVRQKSLSIRKKKAINKDLYNKSTDLVQSLSEFQFNSLPG